MWIISDWWRQVKKRRRVARAIAELEARFANRSSATPHPHGLAAPLIASLTSYPTRFGTLALTLKCLLSQTMPADRVILWIEPDHEKLLPPDVLALKTAGLEIGLSPNYRSFTKIVPTLKAHADCFILTLDDDIYYEAETFAGLVEGYRRMPGTIICHRAHRILMQADGQPLPYGDWTNYAPKNDVSALNFPTGVKGVLYPPGVFHEDACNDALFMQLCPTADDVWLYWMWRLKGHLSVQISDRTRVIEWEGTQTTRLQDANIDNGGNDKALAAMIARYGFPAA